MRGCSVERLSSSSASMAKNKTSSGTSRGWARAHTPCTRDGRVRGRRRRLPDQTQPIHRGRLVIGTQLIPCHVWCSSRYLLAQTTLQVQGRRAWVRGIVGVLGESIADDGCDDRVRKGTRRCCHQTEKSEKRRRDRALLARCSRSLQVPVPGQEISNHLVQQS